MKSLIDLLADLSEHERDDFTNWFKELSVQERNRVVELIGMTTVERLRTILSIPRESRIALFGVQYSKAEEVRMSLSEQYRRSGISERLKAWSDKAVEESKNERW